MSKITFNDKQDKENFEVWLLEQPHQWKSEPPNGEWEVIRYRSPFYLNPVIIFRNKRDEYTTFGCGSDLVAEFWYDEHEQTRMT